MYHKGIKVAKIKILFPIYSQPNKKKNNNNAIIIWTHTRARRNGFAKKLVNLLNIQYAYNPLPESIDFWKACNIKSE
mgnify:CR=1 FL=1